MDEVQEAAIVEAALDGLGPSATAEQILQATRGYSEAAITIALRRLGGGGATAPVSCVIARDSAMDIHDAGDHPILWDALYDNYNDFGTLLAIPDGLGLSFAFDGSSANITTTDAGVWAFTYNFTKNGDNAWVGSLDTRFGAQDIRAGNSGIPMLVSQILAIPSGVTFGPQFNTANQATADPFEIGSAYLIATRLG